MGDSAFVDMIQERIPNFTRWRREPRAGGGRGEPEQEELGYQKNGDPLWDWYVDNMDKHLFSPYYKTGENPDGERLLAQTLGWDGEGDMYAFMEGKMNEGIAYPNSWDEDVARSQLMRLLIMAMPPNALLDNYRR